MIAVNWPAWSEALTLSSACTAALPSPYTLLTPTARAAAVDVEGTALVRDVVVADMSLLVRSCRLVAVRSRQKTTDGGSTGSGWPRRCRCATAACLRGQRAA